MEQWMANTLMEQEVELFCLGGSRYSGVVRAVLSGVVTLEWEEKLTYVAADKIVAVWPREQKEQKPHGMGFIGR